MVAAGQIIRASDDVLLTRVGCRLRRAAVQSISNNTVTSISWDTEDEDTGGFITVTGATIVIPAGNADGEYDITLWVNAQSVEATFHATRNYIDLGITAAAAGIPASFRQKIDSVEDQATVTACNIPLVGGDTVTGRYFQDSGSSQNVTAAWISCYRKGV